MSLNSGKDSGRRPWSPGSWFGIASLIPGLLVVIVSLWCTGAALDGVRNSGKGGDPQGGMASGIALMFLGPVAGGIVLIGSALAFIALFQRPRRWGVVGLAMNLGCPLLCYAFFLVASPFLRPPPPPKTQPTAFYVWRLDNNFGVKAPAIWTYAIPRVHDDYLYNTNWLARHEARMPCETEDEARKFLEATVADLQRVAEEKGVSMSPTNDPLNPDTANKLKLKYQSWPNSGFLDVSYEHVVRLMADNKPEKEYHIYFWLDEFYHRPE